MSYRDRQTPVQYSEHLQVFFFKSTLLISKAANQFQYLAPAWIYNKLTNLQNHPPTGSNQPSSQRQQRNKDVLKEAKSTQSGLTDY